MRISILSGLLAATLALSCGTIDAPYEADDAALAGDEAKADSIASTSTFYRMRKDTRRCMAPLCGGVWVARVNFTTTKCIDGTWAAECYLPEVDYRSFIGEGAAVDAARSNPATVYRGTLRAKTYGQFGNLGFFQVRELWAPVTSRATTAKLYRLTDSGIRCVRAPCPSVHWAKLNSTSSANTNGIDFRPSGATATQIAAANAALNNGGFLAAGTTGTTFSVAQLFTRVRGNADPAYCTADSDCVYSQYTRDISSSSECYCAVCAVRAMNRSAAETNAAHWQQLCGDVPMRCPTIACAMPPPVACIRNKCQPKPL